MIPTPEIIDGMVMQLRAVFEHTQGIPDKVKASGKEFLDDLDKWSGDMKKARG